MRSVILLIFIAVALSFLIPRETQSQTAGGLVLQAAASGDWTPSHQAYIAIRTDNPASAAGTATDPYDGSTPAKFDAVIASLPSDTRINLGPGVFQTDAGIPMKDHWQLYGAGMHVTTIQATQTLLQHAGGSMIISARNLPSPLTIQDMTIDGNFPPPASGQWSIRAIQLTVAKATVQRCYITNCSCGLDQEMFIIFLGPDYSPTTAVPGWGVALDNVIENCAASAGYVDGIAISGGWTGYTGDIERNIFRLASPASGNDIAWNLIWCGASTIQDNVSFGGHFNSDFGGTNSLNLVHNYFLNMATHNVIQIGGGTVDPTQYPMATGQWKNVVVENNYIQLNGGQNQTGLLISNNVIAGVASRNIFTGNAINKYIVNESDTGTTTLTFSNNLIDPVMAGSGYWYNPASVTVTNNYWFDGTPFPSP